MSDITNEEREYLLNLADSVEADNTPEQEERDYLNALADEMEEGERGLLKDAGIGVMRAPSEFGRSILDGLADIDEWLGRNIGVIDFNPFDGDGIGLDTYDEEVHESPFRGLEQEVQRGLDIMPQTERWSGTLVEDGAKWAGWFVGAGKTKLLQLINNPWARSVAAGAVADFAAFDEHEERLSDLLIQAENPIANNIVTQWLASDEDDEWYEGRLKNALEGGALGLMADGIIKGVKILVKARRTEKEILEAAARDKDADLVEQRMKDAEENPFEVIEDTPRMEGEPVRSRFEVRDDGDGLRVLPKDQDQFGDLDVQIDIQEMEDGVYMVYPWVDPDARGLRIGKEMYQTAIEYALSQGKPFYSDVTLSIHARRMWQSLVRDGDYIIRVNQNLDEVRHLTGAPQSTSDRLPMYTVEARTRAPGSKGRLEPKVEKQEIKASDNVDTIATKIEANLGNNPARITAILAEVIETGDVALLMKELGESINMRVVGADDLSDVARKLGEAVYRVAQKDPNFSAETVEHWLKNGARSLSDDLGVDIARLYTDMAADGGNAARLVGTLIGLSDSMAQLAKGIRVTSSEAVSPHAVDEAMMQLEQLQYFSALAAGNSSAAGRALRSLRETKKRLLEGVEALKSEADKMEDLEAKKKVLEAVEQFAREHNLKGVLDAARKSGWVRAEDALRQVGYGNMLSALSTHKANTLGNAIRWAQGMLNAPLSYLGGRIRWAGSKVLGKDTSKMDFTKWDEVVGYWVGAKVGWDQSVRGTGALLRRALDQVSPFVSTEQSLKEWAEESAQLGNLWKTVITGNPVTDNLTRIGDRPVKEAFTAESLFEGHKWFAEAPRFIKSFLSATIDTTGKVYNIPQRLIVSVDELFKTIAFEQHVTTKSYADFGADIRSGEMDIREAAEMIHENQSRAKSAQSIYNDAVEFAREQTFQKALPGFLGKFEATVQAIPMGWLVVPFIRTPTNLFKGAVETLGVTPLMRAVAGPAGKERDRAIGQLMVGTGFTLGAVSLAMDDRLRGKERRGDGIDPYSIRVGDKWYTFDRLDPLGMALGLVADAVDGARNMDTAPEADHWIMQSLGIAASSVSQNLISKTWLRGLTEFLEAATENDPDQAATKWAKFMAQAGTNLLPYAGSNLERREAVEQDEFSRYVFNVIDQLKQRSVSDKWGIGAIVGDRQELGIRRDILGRPIKETGGRSTVIKESAPSDNLLDHMLADYGENWPMPARSFEKGQVKMDTVQYSRYVELRGQVIEIGGMTLEERLENLLIRDERFNSQPTEQQINEIRGWMRQYQTPAREQLFIEYPELQERINATKQFDMDKYLSYSELSDKERDEAQQLLEELGLEPSSGATSSAAK